jgi:anti-sigma-K factor RskA
MEHEKRQFEQDLAPQEREIEGLLGEAMKISPPAGLSSRIAAASTDALLEGQLAAALVTTAPDGLSNRVFTASVSALHETPAVIGRVGFSATWRKLALAACVVFAVFVAVRFWAQPQTQPQPQSQPHERMVVAVATDEVLSVEEEGLLLEDLDLTEFDYLASTRELAFADVALSMNSLRNDLELWQYGLLTE